MLSKASLASLCLMSATAFAASDIGGIQIGQPLYEQRDAIAKLNPDYEIQDLTLTTGQVVGVEAIARKDGKVLDQLIAMQNKAGDIWYLGRAQELEQGGRIEPEVLTASLVEKYGNYTALSAGTNSPNWTYDREGKLYQGALGDSPCFAMGKQWDSLGKVPGLGLGAPRSFSATCGLEINSTTSIDRASGMVRAFAVTITDNKSMYDEIDRARNAAAEQQRRELEAEKAKNNKPKL